MKKYIFLILLLVISTPVYAACGTGRVAYATLSGSNILNSYSMLYYRLVDRFCTENGVAYKCGEEFRPYGSSFGNSTFRVEFTDNHETYFGYCIDPGYRWSNSTELVCCDKMTTATSKALEQGFIYLLETAGNIRKLEGEDSPNAIPIDIAIRLYAMANGLSTSMFTTGGYSYYQLSNYLTEFIEVYKRASILYPGDTSRIELYTRTNMAGKFHGLRLENFISGSNSHEYISRAYTYFKYALDLKNNYVPTGTAINDPSERVIKFEPESVECDDNEIRIRLDKDAQADIYDIIVNNNRGIPTSYSNGQLHIDRSAVLSNAHCDGEQFVMSIEVEFSAPRAPIAYLCNSLSGGRQQQLAVYAGDSGVRDSSIDRQRETFTVVIPNRCTSEHMEGCSRSAYGRCLAQDMVRVDSSINNCCYDPNNGNTSTVSDVQIDKSVNDPLDVEDIFVKDPKLIRDELKSVVKCGTQSMTQAPDFKATSLNATTEEMHKYCQMYCMERSHIITPPPVTVTAGRYFEIDFSKFDIQEQRVCRISVDIANFIKDYISIVLAEIEAVNGYYYNYSRYLLYKTILDNGYEGVHRIQRTVNIPVRCKQLYGAAFCHDGELGWHNPEPIFCTQGNGFGTTFTKYCNLSYEELRYAEVPKNNYPVVQAALKTDVYQNRKAIYDTPNTLITATFSAAGYASLDRGITGDNSNHGFFTLSPSTNCLNRSPWEIAGKPDCTCANGEAIKESVTYYHYVSYCLCDGIRCDDSKCRGTSPTGEWQVDKVYDTYYNGFQTGNGSTYKCWIPEASLDFIDYVMNSQRGFYGGIQGEMDHYRVISDHYANMYYAYYSQIKKSEASFRDCIDFFESGYGSKNMEEHYDVSKIETSFEYDQVYSTTAGGKTTSTTHGHIGHECTVQLIKQDIKTARTFASSGIDTIKLHGMHRQSIFYQVGEFGGWSFPGGISFDKYMSGYNAADSDMSIEPVQKSVTIDGMYVVTCTFDTSGNNYYTLVPGGSGAQDINGTNYVSHDKLFSTQLTAYAGKHEILYHVTGLGSQIVRDFDKYFQTGVTCSGRTSGDVLAPASCYYDVQQKLVTTGTCSEVASATTYETACEITCAGDGTCDSIHNFVFKLADDTDLFPNGVNDSNGWGKNWLTTKGEETRRTIETIGQKDKTYAPENLTYSFLITPKLIESIKNYNKYQINYGGYNDFDLNCDCGGGSHACIHCTSPFLSNLAQINSISSINVNYTSPIALWTNSITIQEVRNRNHNWDKDTTAARAVLS